MNHRALLIDASTGVISEVRIKDYEDIQTFIGCRCFTAVRLNNGETLYVDDEGLINGTTKGFTIAYGGGRLMGNGLVLGSTPDGDSCDTALSVKELAEEYGIRQVFDLADGSLTPCTSPYSNN